MVPREGVAKQLCALIMLCLALPVMGNSTSLVELRWQHRLIVVFTASGSPESEKLKQWVEDKQCELADRETLVITVDSQRAVVINDNSIQLDDVSLAALTQQRRSPEDNTELLLVGKDGGIKERASSISKLDGFVSSIDSMPMRQSEASNTSSNC